MSFKRLLLSIPLVAALFIGCNDVKDPEPLNVLPAGPLADFRFSGGRNYVDLGHDKGFVEYLYTNDTVVTFENLSQNATNYLWVIAKNASNPTADTVSRDMNFTYTFPKVGNYVVNLTAYKIEGADTLGEFTATRTVRITFPRYKLLGKYTMADTVSRLNSTVDSIVVIPPAPSRPYRADYTATISVLKTAASDSNKVLLTTAETLPGTTTIVTRTAIAIVDPTDPFKIIIPNQQYGANDSIKTAFGSTKGGTLRLTYTIKNNAKNTTRYRHGTGKK